MLLFVFWEAFYYQWLPGMHVAARATIRLHAQHIVNRSAVQP